jgi:hypothetical protein
LKSEPELQTFPVSAGLLDPRHVQAIDPSSPWPIYLWFLEHVTRDEQRGDEFVGIVLHGGSISVRQIAEDLGIKERACRRNLARLVKAGYVLQKQTGTGTCIYAVTKSKRWAWKRQRHDRVRPSKAPESQASLSFPIQEQSGDSPHQKVESGSSEPPHQNLASGSPSPHHFFVGSDQKVVSAIRNRPHSHKENLTGGRAEEPPAAQLEQPIPPQSVPDDDAKPRPPTPVIPVYLDDRSAGAIPRDLHPLEYARGVLESLGRPCTNNLLIVVTESIRSLAKSESISSWDAAERIGARALDAVKRGEKVNRFWFEDGGYQQSKLRSKCDVATQQYADRFQDELAILERNQSRAARA